jgi:hypothetical protein
VRAGRGPMCVNPEGIAQVLADGAAVLEML